MAEENDANDVQNLVDEAIADAQASVEEIAQEVEGTQAEGGNEPSVPPVAFQPADETPVVDSSDILKMLGDVDLHVMIELGRTEMVVEDVLKLAEGSVVELDKLAGDPVDVYVNQRLIARGEILVLNDNFCIRVSEIVDDIEEQTEAALEQMHTGKS